MSRTTKALKRLGVPGLVAATIFAGLPAVMASSSSAATGDVVTMTPESDSASVGTCNPFTVTARNSTGGPATSTVDVNIAERTAAGAAATETFNVTFCNEATGGVIPQMPADQSATESNTGNDTDHGEFTVGSDGTFTFGIKSVASTAPAGGPTTGTADITAFIDDASAVGPPAVVANDDTPQGTEAQDSSVKTFTAGGANTTNGVDAEPETQTVFAGELTTIKAKIINTQGDTLAGVTPSGDVTAGPNNAQAVSCGASNNDGIATCTYTASAVGTDTIVIWVNEADPDNNPLTADATGGLDAGESSDTVQATVVTAPSGLTIDLTCGDATTARSTAEDCFNPLSDKNETFSALVKKADGTVASNVVVSFAVTGDSVPDSSTDPAPSLSAAEATTNASGIASVTLTDPSPKDPETITVTATVRGQTPVTSDSGTKTWRTVTAGERNVVLTPESATTTVGTFRTFTAHVTNLNGEPVSGANIRFDESGVGAFRNGSSQVFATTDINGNATVDVTSGSTETGTQTITATIFGAECARLAGDPAGSSAGNCTDSSTNTFAVAASPSSPPPSSPAPGCSTAEQNLPVRVNTPTINATGLASVTITGARPNGQVEVQGYSQNHYLTANFNNDPTPIDRRVTAGSDGTVTINDLRPASNTRLRARVFGCAFGTNALGSVINVRTQLTLAAKRIAIRTVVISGGSIPARPGGLIVGIYRDGKLIGQSRASQTSGNYSVTLRFPAADQGKRINLTARTGQDAQNAPGISNVRSLLIT